MEQVSHMTTDLVGVAPGAPLPVRDYRACCDVWALDEDGLVLASFLGPHTVLQSVWAQLMAGQFVELDGGTILRRQNTLPGAQEARSSTDPEGNYKVRYQRASVRFAQIEQAHLVVIAEPATLHAASGHRAYLVAPHMRGDLERFFAVWNKVVSLPARPDWARYLWEAGLRRSSIKPIAAYGCCAWSIEPQSETWSEIIWEGIEDHVLT